MLIQVAHKPLTSHAWHAALTVFSHVLESYTARHHRILQSLYLTKTGSKHVKHYLSSTMLSSVPHGNKHLSKPTLPHENKINEDATARFTVTAESVCKSPPAPKHHQRKQMVGSNK